MIEKKVGTLLVVLGWLVLVFGCGGEFDKADEARHAEAARIDTARWVLIAEHAKDIESCRGRGGVPITNMSYASYPHEYRAMLTRCEFPPCPPAVVAEKDLKGR